MTVFTPWGPHRQAVWQRYLVRDAAGNPVLVGAGDQSGDVPVAAVLDAWARYWCDERGEREHHPDPQVPTITRWLEHRLDWAMNHGSIVDFAVEIRAVRQAVADALGDTEQLPERIEGVACRLCGRRMLVRRADGTGDVECTHPDCRRVYDVGEYRRWTKVEVLRAGQTHPELVNADHPGGSRR